MNIEPVRVYAREVICGECGTAMLLGWHNPMELSQGGDPVYEHPDNHCDFKGKRLRATALVCAASRRTPRIGVQAVLCGRRQERWEAGYGVWWGGSMKKLILKVTHRIWNGRISSLLCRACEKGIINSHQLHELAAMFDPTQKHQVY